MAVYGQPKMLARQLQEFRTYQSDIRDKLRLIIVDDHGDPAVTREVGELFNTLVKTTVVRIDTNIPWNQPGARNLGMRLAETDWCLMLDPDMVVPADMLFRMMAAANSMQRGELVKFGLKHVNEPKRDVDMSSPNTYLIHREDFWDVGGYDEAFAGHKGWSDVQLLDILNACYRIHKRPDLHALFYSTNQIADAAVTSLDRSTRHNRALRLKRVGQAKKAGGWAKWARARTDAVLRFTWTPVFCWRDA